VWRGGSKMAAQASPPPRGDPPKWPPRDPPLITRWPATCHVTMGEERGETSHFFKYSLIKGYFKRPISQNLSAKLAPTLLQCQSLPISFLWAVRRENVAYIVIQAYTGLPKQHAVLNRLHYILQATSLQKAVNIKNKAGHNSTRGTVGSLLSSRRKNCCTQSTSSTSFIWREVIDSRLI
jgi:hypothetical protein